MKPYSMCFPKRLPCVLGAALMGAAIFNAPAIHGDPAPPQNPAPVEAPAAVEAPAPPVLASNTPAGGGEAVADSHISLSLRDAPVTHMLSLVSSLTTVKFRYATPPDARITATFNDVPLVPTLTAWMGATGFELQRAGADFFVLRDTARQSLLPRTITIPAIRQTKVPSIGNNGDSAPGWAYWSRPAPPPATWVVPAASGSIVVGMGTRARQENARDEDAWRSAAQSLMPELRPGVSVAMPSQNGGGPLYLRCQIPLKFVPPGAQLILDTPAEATLYVNGALVLRRWKGRRILDLSRMLTAGHNCLAIKWFPIAREKALPPGTPLLRYEWFFAADAN